MSITDELRDWGRRWATTIEDEISDIADRIDAAHRSALEKLAAQVDESGALPMTDENMAEHGWMRLPVDADGVPIHVGDVMEVKFDTKRRPFTVSFVGERAVAFWVVGQPDLKSFNLDTVLVTHHHEPTVEDVLREMLSKYDELRLGSSAFDPFELMAEYAAKLRLREENE